MPSKHTQVRIPLPDAQIEQLKQAAESRGLTVAELIRQALVKQKLITSPELRKWEVSQDQE